MDAGWISGGEGFLATLARPSSARATPAEAGRFPAILNSIRAPVLPARGCLVDRSQRSTRARYSNADLGRRRSTDASFAAEHLAQLLNRWQLVVERSSGVGQQPAFRAFGAKIIETPIDLGFKARDLRFGIAKELQRIKIHRRGRSRSGRVIGGVRGICADAKDKRLGIANEPSRRLTRA